MNSDDDDDDDDVGNGNGDELCLVHGRCVYRCKAGVSWLRASPMQLSTAGRWWTRLWRAVSQQVRSRILFHWAEFNFSHRIKNMHMHICIACLPSAALAVRVGRTKVFSPWFLPITFLTSSVNDNPVHDFILSVYVVLKPVLFSYPGISIFLSICPYYSYALEVIWSDPRSRRDPSCSFFNASCASPLHADMSVNLGCRDLELQIGRSW